MNDTALGVALKSVTKRKKEKKTIRVCDICETPLIWTFAFPYAERYCLNCGAKGGMLGTGIDVDATQELEFKENLVNAIWKVIYGKKNHLMPSGSFTRSNCKKCDNSDCHRDHASKKEKEGDILARRYLEKVQGLFN